MKIIKTEIKDLLLIKPVVFGDHRGFFLEQYSERSFKDAGIDIKFIQDNHY